MTNSILTAKLTRRTLITWGTRTDRSREWVPAGTIVRVRQESLLNGLISIKVPGFPGSFARVPVGRIDANV